MIANGDLAVRRNKAGDGLRAGKREAGSANLAGWIEEGVQAGRLRTRIVLVYLNKAA